MNPLLLLLLVGGAVAVAASGGGGSRKPLRLGYFQPDYEKFQDPLYGCFGVEGTPYVIADPPNRHKGLRIAIFRPAMDDNQKNVVLGYEYLSTVPRNANARIAAIRAKVDAWNKGASYVKSQPWFWLPSPEGHVNADVGITVANAIKNSHATLNNFADTIANKYASLQKDVKAVKAFAEAYGVSTSSVDAEVKSLAKAIGSVDSIKVVDKAVREYGPIASAIVNALFQTLSSSILSGGTGPGAADKRIADSLNAIGSMASVIPVYGTVIKGVTDLLASAYQGSAEAKEGECRAVAASIFDKAKEAAGLGYVVPWHFEAIFPPNACFNYGVGATGAGNLSDDQDSARLLVGDNLKYQAGTIAAPGFPAFPINPVYRNAIKSWWAVVQIYLSHPKVSEVFSALGRDAKGGVIASDEQVMLVAAPYAVANGFDVDEFAKELWTRSSGWSGADSHFFAEPYTQQKIDQFKLGDICYGVVGKNAPMNAWWLQWAILAQDAEQIVADWRANPAVAKRAEDPVVPLMKLPKGLVIA